MICPELDFDRFRQSWARANQRYLRGNILVSIVKLFSYVIRFLAFVNSGSFYPVALHLFLVDARAIDVVGRES